MKLISYLFIFLLTLTSVSAICYNQDNSPFCSKTDPTCMHEGDVDTDNDGWSNSCDAFPDNELFFIDYDGDDVGYGLLVYDCNDLDDTELTYCGDTSLLEATQDDETNETEIVETTNTRSRTRRPIIYVSDPNERDEQPVEQENEQGEEFENEPTVLPPQGVPPQKEILPPSQAQDSGNQITGAVTGGPFTGSVLPLWLLLLFVLVLLVIVFIRRRIQSRPQTA